MCQDTFRLIRQVHTFNRHREHIFGLMQRHNFQFKEFGISETIRHFVQRFDLIVNAFQQVQLISYLEVEISKNT